MLFNSLTFVIFAPLVWLVWWILGRPALNDRRYWAMVMVMLTASFVYYSWQGRLDRILVHFFLMPLIASSAGPWDEVSAGCPEVRAGAWHRLQPQRALLLQVHRHAYRLIR
jgi:hypothetical protein